MSQTEVQLIKDAVIVNADVSNSAAIDVSKISGVMPLAGGSFTDDVTFTGASANIVFDKSDNALEFADNAKATFGTGGDLEITHGGSNSAIAEVGTGNLEIKTNSSILLQKGDSEFLAKFISDGAVELYHDNSKRFETTSAGIDVTGRVTADDLTIENSSGNLSAFFTATNGLGTLEVGGSTGAFIDLKTPASDDFDIRFDASGTMTSKGNIQLNVNGNESGVHVTANGAVSLFHDNVKTVETSSSHLLVFADNSGNHGGIKVRNTNTGNSSRAEIRLESENAASFATIFCDHQNTNLRLGYNSTGTTVAIDGNADMITGTIIPNADNSKNLGSASFRWANIFTTDLKLSNEGSQNDVDGTWGNYTIQEGHEDLFLINHRTGKKFKFNLTEVA